MPESCLRPAGTALLLGALLTGPLLIGSLLIGTVSGASAVTGGPAGSSSGSSAGSSAGPPTRAGAGPAIAVPRPERDWSNVALLGASTDGIAVVQGVSRVLTGNPLTYTGLDVSETDSSEVRGHTLRWSQFQDGKPGQWVVHSRDLLTATGTASTTATTTEAAVGAAVGAATETYLSPARPLAWTANGWITYSAGTLTRHVIGGTDQTLLTGLLSTPDEEADDVLVVADDDGAAVRYATMVDGVRQQQVALIRFDRAGAEILETRAEKDEFGLGTVALSPNTVVWSTVGPYYKSFLHRRGRGGGPVSTIAEPSAVQYSLDTLLVTDDQILASETVSHMSITETTLWALKDRSWRDISVVGAAGQALSDSQFDTAAVLGSQFLVSMDGPPTEAGVYVIGTGDGAPLALPGSDPVETNDVSLSAGLLTYTGLALPGSRDWEYQTSSPLWQRSIQAAAATREPAFGPVSTIDENVAVPGSLSFGTVSETSFSASRGVTHEPSSMGFPASYQWWDRGRRTRTLAVAGDRTRVSGPFALLGRRLYRADGRRLLDLRTANVVAADLFGDRVVDCERNGTVRLRRVPSPGLTGGAGSSRLVGQKCAGQVAVWGATVAWARTDGTIAIRRLPATALRIVKPGGPLATGSAQDEPAAALRLSEGALSWRTLATASSTASAGSTASPARSWLLNLRSPTSVPVLATGLHAVVTDDHLMAGIDRTGTIQLGPLPFGASSRYRPRLVGLLSQAAFVRNWVPQFDISKPVQSVTLTVTRGSEVVRTLTGTGPNGSIRDLSWNGRDDQGRLAPPGRYRWRLNAQATDGDGALIGPGGSASVTGTIRRNRR